MKRAGTVLLSAAVLLAGCQKTLNPPKQYDHPYKGELHVYYADEFNMKAQCFAPENGNKVWGCAFVWPKSCDVWILNSEDADSQAQIMRHEIAHCNGWPPDHKDGKGPPNDGGAQWPTPSGVN